MKKAVIFSGGTIDAPAALAYLEKEKPEIIIAADKGTAFCESHQIRPDYIVGDFDGLTGAADVLQQYRSAGVPIDTFRPEKDMTDSDIALEKAVATGADAVCFFGATGTRLDHVFSSIFDLYKLYAQGIEGVIIDGHNRISMPVSRQIVIRRDAQYGKYVSMYPFRGEAHGVTLTGFKYPLEDADIVQGDGGLTTSNEIVAEEGVITCREGILIVMETKD
ncbi:MAG: thiamine diphosphokinase [Eubacterium sp.]|nr:thiamine diphosphokinase [Eubacterium sp.]